MTNIEPIMHNNPNRLKYNSDVALYIVTRMTNVVNWPFLFHLKQSFPFSIPVAYTCFKKNPDSNIFTPTDT